MPLHRKRSASSLSDRESIWPPAEDEKPQVISDVDVEFADIDPRIRRCQERIANGICTKGNEIKLTALEAAKNYRKQLMDREPGLNWETVKRLQTLEMIKQSLEEDDHYKELVNVKAIISAYRSGKLSFDGNATYWCNGKPLEGPKPFSWEDFRRLNTAEHRQGGGFWVEGLTKTLRYKSDHAHTPQENPEVDLVFADDTGAQMMMMYKDDMDNLMGTTGATDSPWDHIMGFDMFRGAIGEPAMNLLLAVEVNICAKGLASNLLPGRTPLKTSWMTVPCCISAAQSTWLDGTPKTRLSGPWLRQMLYTATAPEFPGSPSRMYISTTKSGLSGRNMLPAHSIATAVPLQFEQPQWGVAKVADPGTGRVVPFANKAIPGRVPP
ncbi:hypothetical protein N7462_001865 [Penicillium macrosclerotiorum]|uniref:uncharacterized protein n=1 Tax=Penicillium macrosclerotiorum TaxID=303699 RepID=UPI00254691C2|nr:uncharacterized protein N7462_001865 [Penicillium macrosclerotiorum]KAJ5692442.1 hypothetical protein N7462_001865 [Penicillium macrosclerotiorum]